MRIIQLFGLCCCRGGMSTAESASAFVECLPAYVTELVDKVRAMYDRGIVDLVDNSRDRDRWKDL